MQRKQARTGQEREEDEDDIVNAEDSDDEDEEVVYNPKNLPLGWDGKVILNMKLEFKKNYSHKFNFILNSQYLTGYTNYMD